LFYVYLEKVSKDGQSGWTMSSDAE